MTLAIPAASVPTITAIREALEYGDSQQRRCQSFYDDVRAFRKKFVTSDGTKGRDLFQWKEESHRSGLLEMAESYLEKHGNGALFWPDDLFDDNYNGLRYSENASMITDLIAQLFFRINLQSHRNEKYRQKSASAKTVADARGSSTEYPIELDDSLLDEAAPAPVRQTTSTPPPFTTGKFKVGPNPTDFHDKVWKQPHRNSHKRSLDESRGSLSPRPSEEPLEDHVEGPQDQRRDGYRHDEVEEAVNFAVASLTSYHPPVNDKNSQEEDPDYEPPQNKRHKPRAAAPHRKGATAQAVNGSRVESSTTTPRTSPRFQRTIDIFNMGTEGARVEDEATEPARPDTEPTREASATIAPSPDPGMAAIDMPMQPNDNDIAPVRQLAPEAQMDVSSAVEETVVTVQSPPPGLILAPGTTIVKGPATPLPQPSPRPVILIDYQIILTRAPRFECVSWTPVGKFTDKTLAEIKQEIPLDLGGDSSAKGLLFTLLAPDAKIRYEICHGQEDLFTLMKRKFERAIRNQIMRGMGKEPLCFEIEIEALRDEEKVKNELDEWEGDLGW